MSVTNDNGAAAEFDIEMAPRGFEGADVPTTAYVEVVVGGATLFAIIAAGDAGRWSFDFDLDASGVVITRTYEEGVRIDTDELPDWIGPIREAIEQRLTAAQ